LKETQITRHILITAFLLVANAAGYAAEQGKDDAKGIICEGFYALCTSAPCIPDPENTDGEAICRCKVNEGINFGTTQCSERTPVTSAHGVKTLVSTYSFAQGPTKPMLSCPKGKPWTNCLDRPCTVDPMNPLVAICKCDIVRDESFVTYGGDCNTLTCDTGYWSGATVETNVEGSKQLLQKMGLKDIPVMYCPGMGPKAE